MDKFPALELPVGWVKKVGLDRLPAVWGLQVECSRDCGLTMWLLCEGRRQGGAGDEVLAACRS